ncbi:MAG: MBL fold metallo-hydrolase [Solirubrobacterales bacterium]|nr:MBL fold metallo-hydrolase [Solirubrobacterales bacterium]HMT05323.1 MBL fold metallo-hydrolase [Solirubrobacterales bacterium]
MNTRFHVPTKVFGSRRSRDDRPEGDAVNSPPTPSQPAALLGSDPILVDPMLNDSPGKSSSYLIPGTRVALVDPGPANAAPKVLEALKARGIRVDLILLSHIHPNAAAGAGVIARQYPKAEIAAPAGVTGLLADPTELVSDLKKLHGEEVCSIFGMPTPIPGDRIRALADGDRIDLGDRVIEVISTPGHTADHMAFLDPATSSLFCGDALGVQLPGSRVVRPSTPPWDFSFEDSLNSIDRLSEVEASNVYLDHFGAARPGPEEIFDRSADSLENWHESFLKKQAQTDSEEDLSRQFNACLEASLEPIAPAVRRDLEAVSPAWLNLRGLRIAQSQASGLSDAA